MAAKSDQGDIHHELKADILPNNKSKSWLDENVLLLHRLAAKAQIKELEDNEGTPHLIEIGQSRILLRPFIHLLNFYCSNV